MDATLRGIAMAVTIGLIGWVGYGVENLKISVAEIRVEIAHIQRKNESSQYVAINR